MGPGAIVGAIANEGGLHRSDFGHITIKIDHSLVELPAKLSRETLKALENTRISGCADRPQARPRQPTYDPRPSGGKPRHTRPMTASSEVDQGGLEAVSGADRVASLTGVRAVAALLVVGTHAAYTTGKYTHGLRRVWCIRGWRSACRSSSCCPASCCSGRG